MTIIPRRLNKEVRALADALEGIEGRADIQVRLSCSSDAELEHIADSLGVEVQTRSGTKLAQRQFGPLLLMASVDQSAPSPGEGSAMTKQEIRQALQDRSAESARAVGGSS